MFNNDTWFDPAYARSTFRPITNNALDLGTNSMLFRSAYVNNIYGASNLVLGVNATTWLTLDVSGLLSFVATNFRINANTSDGSDNKGMFLCGGGSNTTTRGGVLFLGGNEYSGSNGLTSLSAGDASSAYLELKAPASTAPTIRFVLTSSEIWRMSGNELTGMVSSNHQIARTNDTGWMIISGGSGAGAAATGAYLTLRGASATTPGVALLCSGSNSGAYAQYNAAHASGSHRFLIADVEQWRMLGADLIGYESSSNLNQIERVNNLGRLILCGGTDSNTANGSSIALSGVTYGGTITLNAGNVSTGNINYNVLHASGSHRFSIGGSEKVRFNSSGIVLYNGTGMGIYRENDTGYTFLAGGTAIAVANGSYILAYGNSHASNPGRLFFYSGTGSGLMVFEMGLSTGAFRFRNASAVNLLDISDSQFYCNVPTGGDYSWRINNVQLMSLSAGGITLPSLADGVATNSKFYYSTTQNKPCYKDSGGTVNVLY